MGVNEAATGDEFVVLNSEFVTPTKEQQKLKMNEIMNLLTSTLPAESKLFEPEKDQYENYSPSVYRAFLHEIIQVDVDEQYDLLKASLRNQITHNKVQQLLLTLVRKISEHEHYSLPKPALNDRRRSLPRSLTVGSISFATVSAAITGSFQLKKPTNSPTITPQPSNVPKEPSSPSSARSLSPRARKPLSTYMSSNNLSELVFSLFMQMYEQALADATASPTFEKKLHELLGEYELSDVVYLCTEKWVFENIFQYVFSPKTEDVQHDLDLFNRIASLSFIEPHHLSIPDSITKSSQWSDAVHSLRKITNYTAPKHKLNCIERSIRSLFAAISSLSAGDEKCADDLVPATILLVLKANPKFLHSNIKFLKMFGMTIHESEMIRETGYFFTTLESAVYFIERCTEKSFKIEPAEFQKHWGSKTKTKPSVIWGYYYE